MTLQRRTLLLTLVLSVASAIGIAAMSADQRYVAIPAAVSLVLAVAFLCEVWNRAKSFPVFELGSFLVGTTFLYTFAPLFQHLLSGLQFTPLSDFRLAVNAPSPEEFGGFAWNHIVYLVALVGSYLWTRGKPSTPRGDLVLPGKSVLVSALVIYIGLTAWLQILSLFFGYNANDTYRNFGQFAQAKAAMPYVLVQVTEQARNFTIFLETLLLLYLFRGWSNPTNRLLTFGWLVLKVGTILLAMGDRSPMALFMVTLVLLFDRFVRPVHGTTVMVFLFTMIVSLLVYGFIRDVIIQGRTGSVTVLSTTNEFMGVWSTSYDVFRRYTSGAMDRPPTTLYFADFLTLIPQQLSPFDKVNKGQWYVQQIGMQDSGVGYMWGVVSSSVIGLGKLELVLRGLFVGWFGAKIHRWYVAHGRDWRAVVLYVILCLQAYYTFRSDTLSVLIFLEYGYVAPLIALWWLGRILRGGRFARRTETVAA